MSLFGRCVPPESNSNQGRQSVAPLGEDGSAPASRGYRLRFSIHSVFVEFRRLSVEFQALSDIFSHTETQERAKIEVPKEIVEGWIHLLMGFIYLLTEPDTHYRLTDDANTLIRAGITTMVRSLSEKSLLESSVVLPLMSLLSLDLLQDVTKGTQDITAIYFESLHEMVSSDNIVFYLETCVS